MSWIHKDRKILEQVTDNLTDFRKSGALKNDFIDEIIAACHTPKSSAAGGFSWDVAMLEIRLKKHT